MSNIRGRRLLGWASLAACLFTAAVAAADETPALGAPETPVLSLDQLAQMSWPELECLYREADAGAIPQGYTTGKAIYSPCSPFAGLHSRVTGALWHGKVFDNADCSLVNQWSGFRAIHAHVAYGSSCLDGKTSIVMDYGETSLVWADVRDEVREVAPGLYLGRMYRRKKCGLEFQFFFALQACCR
jgi:hypothetical protein